MVSLSPDILVTTFLSICLSVRHTSVLCQNQWT